MKLYQTLIIGLAGLMMVGCSSRPVQTGAISQAIAKASVVTPVPVMPAWLLHLPGIGGERSIDLAMTRGFQQGGFTGDVEIYDWTEHDPGLSALVSEERNHKEAKLIAAKITERFDKDPSAPIYLSCHSGGGGLAVWALEDLPPRVRINTLLMMSPALSPKYDLSEALRHVSGKVYVFSSTEDVLILCTGCKLMGTIDGVKVPAAGFCGFVRPISGDVGQYAKLVPMPYNPQWYQYGDNGNHVGAMNREFAKWVLAPLVLSGKSPLLDPAPAGNDTAVSGRTGQAVQ